jgi:maltooligosyltrehalose trehalohydrolase
LTHLLTFEQLKLAAGALLLSPFIPLLFMGEEYGERAPFSYFVSHGDNALIEAVRQGRRQEYARFAWQGETPDPQSETTFLASQLNWDLRTQGQHQVLWDFYKELLRLRKTVPALAVLDKNRMQVQSHSDQNMLLVIRGQVSRRILAVFHFGSSASEQVPLPAGRWVKLLDSADQRWEGKEHHTPQILESPSEERLILGSWTFVLFAEAQG